MRHFYILGSLLVSSVAFTYGQITLLSTDMVDIGDQVVRYIDSIPAYGPGSAGANQTWDFSGAVNEYTTNTSVMSVGSTPYASTFPGSSYAMQGDANSFLYFTETTGNLTTDGAAGDLLLTGEMIEAPFTDGLILHVFPRTYGDYHNDTYSFVAEADGSAFGVYAIRLTHSGHVYDTTDGYGSLITPTGIYDALRVKTTDFTHDIIETQFSEFVPIWTEVSNTLDTTVSYSWHSKLEKLAIAEYSYDSIGNPGRFVYSTVSPVVSTGPLAEEKDGEAFLYPQPADDRLCVGGLDAVADHRLAYIYGIAGNILWEGKLEHDCLEVNHLKPGTYLLRLTRHDGLSRNTLRFTVRR